MAIKKILIPLDGSENAEKIGGWVAGIAVPLGAELALTTIVDPSKVELPDSTAEHGHPIPGRPGKYDRAGHESALAMAGSTGIVAGTASRFDRGGASRHAPAFGTQILDRVMQQAGEYLEGEAGRLSASGVKTTFKALMGDPAELIVKHADDIKADMIAMATHRGSAIARGVLGSVTDRVLRSSHVPVMAVHPESLTAFSGANGQPEVVVVPLDGSKRSESAVGLAVELAEACGSEIVFLRVVQYPYGVSEIDAAYTCTDYTASHQRLEAETYLARFAASAKERGLNARVASRMGAPAPRLLDEVKTLSRPLIVMSSRGASGIKRWVVGSVTDKVVRSSGPPVLVVPPDGE